VEKGSVGVGQGVTVGLVAGRVASAAAPDRAAAELSSETESPRDETSSANPRIARRSARDIGSPMPGRFKGVPLHTLTPACLVR
jgi:hypothetical protein